MPCWGALLLWLALFTKVAQYWRRNRLGLVDFDASFFRNLLYSEAFRIDFAYWVVRAVLDTAAMALFIRVLLAVADPQKQLRVLPNPTWQGDAAVLAGVLRRQLGRLRRWVLARWKRWGVRVTAVALCLGLAAWMLAGSPPPQLLHPPVVIGHRGCIYETENTLAAVRAAGDYGAQYAEIDVQLSADGVPVVLHDGNLWRLAGENRGRGRPHRGGAHLPATAAHGATARPGSTSPPWSRCSSWWRNPRASWACWWSSSPRAATAPP